jgi:ribosomal protein S18 acetylase RimI-like enzyme
VQSGVAIMMTFEEAQSADLPQLVDLLNTLFSIERDFVADGVRQMRALQKLLRAPDAAVMVARLPDRRVVGMASGQLVISTAEGAPSVWIEDVVVAESWRQQGVGRSLIKAVEDWGRERGATRAQLLADDGNHPALDFYRSQGWSRTRLIALRRLLA